MKATLIILAISLAVAFGPACALLGVSPSSRFKITERFTDRLGQVEVFGVHVRSALADGIVSDEDLEKLSGFFSTGLQTTTIGLITNLNAGGDPEKMAVILTVDINVLKAATQEERRNRVPSYLHGTIALHRVSSGKELGKAIIWTRGSGLNLKSNYMPNTVREFTSVIRRIVQ